MCASGHHLKTHHKNSSGYLGYWETCRYEGDGGTSRLKIKEEKKNGKATKSQVKPIQISK